MLRLLLPMLGGHWQSSESSTSDVVILEAETLAELRGAGAAKMETLYVAFGDDGPAPEGAFATIQRPLNSARLVELLHMAQAELEKRSGLHGNTTINPTAGNSADAQTLERSIRTSMRTAVRWTLQDKKRAVTVQDLKQVKLFSVLPAMGFTTRLLWNDLADLIRANKPVDLVELNQKEQLALLEKRNFDPLTKLEWTYWLTGSNGEIRPELKVSRRYQLRKYPDFAGLPHYRADVRMASLLKAEPLTVGDLAHRADVRLETACNFVNACWALGYLGDPGARSASAKKAATKAAPREEANKQEEESGLLTPLRKLGLFRRK